MIVIRHVLHAMSPDLVTGPAGAASGSVAGGDSSRLVRLSNALWLLAALAMALVGFANCGLAFVFPLELEAREGTSWLHVMALEAHVPLYDHSRVAFLNMNHGPLDPMLKYAIHALLPFLQPAMVTRVFVLLLPLGVFWALFRALEKRLLAAVVCTGGLYLFLLGLTPFHFLIGRSDPAALFFLALMLAELDASTRKAPARGSRFSWGILGAGLLGSAVFLINWRYLPYAVGGGLAWILEAAWDTDGKYRDRGLFLLLHLGTFALGLLVPFAAVLLGVFHGDFGLYYSHFFGFFLNDGDRVDWVWLVEAPFNFFPRDLLVAHWPAHAFLLLVGGVVLFQRRNRKLWWQFILLRLPLLAGLWIITAYSYSLNPWGGGPYYFAPFYLFLVFLLGRWGNWSRLDHPRAGLVFLIMLLGSISWPALLRQARLLEENLGRARKFVIDVQRLTGGTGVYSEDLYLFETRYDGQVIDMGDIVFQTTEQGGYGNHGEQFKSTARRAFARLRDTPPKFVIMGSSVRVASPVLGELVGKLYQPLLQAPPHLFANGGGGAVLYRLRPTFPAAN